ncbi:MAG: hypothetical protein ACLFWF_10600 [Alphaproteobacteria bacterium]
MADQSPVYDEHFRNEARRARRLFFLLLPVAGAAGALSWALSSGAISGADIGKAAEQVITSVYGFFGGGTR